MTSAPYIRPGRLRLRAELQARVETPDGMGGNDYEWQTERSIWCAIRQQSGREAVAAMREQSSLTYEIWVRYANDITPDKRIAYNGKTYNVRAILNPKEANEFLRIIAESGVAT